MESRWNLVSVSIILELEKTFPTLPSCRFPPKVFCFFLILPVLLSGMLTHVGPWLGCSGIEEGGWDNCFNCFFLQCPQEKVITCRGDHPLLSNSISPRGGGGWSFADSSETWCYLPMFWSSEHQLLTQRDLISTVYFQVASFAAGQPWGDHWNSSKPPFSPFWKREGKDQVFGSVVRMPDRMPTLCRGDLSSVPLLSTAFS